VKKEQENAVRLMLVDQGQLDNWRWAIIVKQGINLINHHCFVVVDWD
jgi:hypothetical protein